jgi:hypothetical protein
MTHPRYLDCPSHDRMKQVMQVIHALFPVGSVWYTRLGDVHLTVTGHNAEGVLFEGDQGYGCVRHEPDSLLNGTLMAIADVSAIGVERCFAG